MNCSEVQELLSPYADSMLEAGETDLITEHLSTCSDCFSEYQSLQGLISALKSVENQELPEGFNERLMSRLRPPERKRLVIPSWYPVGAVAAILMILFVGLSPGNIQDFQPGGDGRSVGKQQQDINTREKTGYGSPNQIAAEAFPENGEFSSDKKGEISTGDRTQDAPVIGDTFGQPSMELFKEPTPGSSSSDTLDSPRGALRNSVSNGFRNDSGLEKFGSARYGDHLYSASALMPSDSQGGEEMISLADSPEVSGGGQGVMRLSVMSLDSALGRLESLIDSLGGEVTAVPSKAGASGNNVISKRVSCTVSIPSSAVTTFVHGVTSFGDLAGNKQDQTSTLASGGSATVEELQQRKDHLSNLLLQTSNLDKIRELREEIASVDREIVNQQASLGQKSSYTVINIIVEEKGN